MSDSALLDLVKSYLAARAQGTSVSPAENSAWRAFYTAHDRIIRSVVKRHGPATVDIDDLDQDVWFSLLRRLPKLDLDLDLGRGTLDGYVAAAAHREAAKHAHRKRRRRAEELTEELASRLLDQRLGPEPETEQRQRREQVQAVVAELSEGVPEPNRRIVEEHFLSGRVSAEIAVALGISEERVKSVIRRFRPRLYTRLRRIGFDANSEKL